MPRKHTKESRISAATTTTTTNNNNNNTMAATDVGSNVTNNRILQKLANRTEPSLVSELVQKSVSACDVYLRASIKLFYDDVSEEIKNDGHNSNKRAGSRNIDITSTRDVDLIDYVRQRVPNENDLHSVTIKDIQALANRLLDFETDEDIKAGKKVQEMNKVDLLMKLRPIIYGSTTVRRNSMTNVVDCNNTTTKRKAVRN